jgi:hypothetical protein
MTELVSSIIKYTSLFALIFVTIFGLILLTRFILMLLIERSYQRYLTLKKATKNVFPSKKKNYEKEEEDLKRTIEIPKAHSAAKAERKEKSGRESGSYELMASEEREETQQVEIVDFVKPIGFWTSMILGQKLTYLIQSAQVLNKRDNKGFWVSMIEAKDRAAGRQHGRGR